MWLPQPAPKTSLPALSASPVQPKMSLLSANRTCFEPGFGLSTSIVEPLPAFPALLAKLQTTSCPRFSPKVAWTTESACGPASPFLASTVEPIATSLSSRLRIDVLSDGTTPLVWEIEACHAALGAPAP